MKIIAIASMLGVIGIILVGYFCFLAGQFIGIASNI